MSRADTATHPAIDMNNEEIISELNKALEILLEKVPPDTMQRMTIEEFGLTPRGLAIRCISSAIEIIEDMDEDTTDE